MTYGLTVIRPPAFGTRHDHNIPGTEKDGDRFGITGCPSEQEDSGTSNTAGISDERDIERVILLTILKPEGC